MTRFVERDSGRKIIGEFGCSQNFPTEPIEENHPDLIAFRKSQEPPVVTSYVTFWSRMTEAEQMAILRFKRAHDAGVVVEGFLLKLTAQALPFATDEDVKRAKAALVHYGILDAKRAEVIFASEA